jgi:hypothetical protein
VVHIYVHPGVISGIQAAQMFVGFERLNL